MRDVPGELATIGSVVRPHGVRGELVVVPTGPAIADVAPGAAVWLEDDRATHTIERIRPHRGRWLVRLRDVTDRDAAAALRGSRLRIPVEHLPPPDGEEFYVHDLLGCAVIRADGTWLGEIARVIPGNPHDLMEVVRERDTVLVPMARDWLVGVDLHERRITIDLPPGLEETTSLGG